MGLVSNLRPFTVDNAREFSKRANEIRWSRERERKAKLLNAGNPVNIAEQISADELARARELKRLKKQLDNFDTLIEAETDAKALQMLTNARWKQFETWRILAGMPTPGSFKPVQARSNRNKLTELPDPE